MAFSVNRISSREKLILAGLYLAKYDSVGLKQLGFTSFTEAFNVLGYALGSRPASIKNYRDEFDPLFPNQRKGWHRRQIRDYCRVVYEEFNALELEPFSGLVRSFVGHAGIDREEGREEEKQEGIESSFARRLITGLAAEQYFETVLPTIREFEGYVAENTTRLGCGYDFRLLNERHPEFLAVEVKGLKERAGSLSMTSKEHETAAFLGERYFLFIAKNFQESPCHEVVRNPLSSQLQFRKTERVVIQVSWQANV